MSNHVQLSHTTDLTRDRRLIAESLGVRRDLFVDGRGRAGRTPGTEFYAL
jgi:hypothetical protein